MGLSVFLASLHINSFPEDSSVNSCFTFLSLAPLFGVLFCEPQLSLPFMQLISVVTFGLCGSILAEHFHLRIYYGIFIGCIQGVFFPLFLKFQPGGMESIMNPLFSAIISWVALDYVIAYIFGIAVTIPIQLYRFPLLLQPISVFGFSSIGALVIASNCLLGLQIAEISRRPRVFSSEPIKLVGILFLGWFLTAMFIAEILRFRDGVDIQVTTVSPGYKFNGNISDLIEMTREAVQNGSEFVVWPEAYVRPPEKRISCEKYIHDHILSEIEHLKAYLVVGCAEYVPGACPIGNLAFVISPDQKILGSYGKQHPVTMIGEESCIRNGYRNYQISNLNISFSTLICYDTDFEDSPAIVADMGTSLILNPSEDWAAARGHFAAAVFRAVENRVAIAKSDWGWDSAIIGPDGTVKTYFTSKRVNRAILSASVTIYPQNSRTNRLRSSAFPLLCIGISIGMLLVKILQRRESQESHRSLIER